MKSVSVALLALCPVMFQPVVAQSLVEVQGTVMTGHDGTPLSGARVHLVRVGSEERFLSEATASDGTFRVAGLPSATYRAAVELDGGLYVVEAPVLVAGEGLDRLDLAIPALADTLPAARKGAAGFWSTPAAATLVVVGSALSVGALFKGNGRLPCGNAPEHAQSQENSNCTIEPEASAFSPNFRSPRRKPPKD